jgi:hypothetical protein
MTVRSVVLALAGAAVRSGAAWRRAACGVLDECYRRARMAVSCGYWRRVVCVVLHRACCPFVCRVYVTVCFVIGVVGFAVR